ncbi:MAG TPA: tetratricopeptide repeat protein [Ramlibacter sp.]|uniref:tetratricopeptide repeat protein n=1 Tax=Ramlibacter sp. TaxID=1917967 RepID=UPI002D7EF047|nr:tetratricopeptide repeat protein [Ramlibacter sp.]HET8744485.1 tetratricopeptide repeat protein [Ramlibacter sp.]
MKRAVMALLCIAALAWPLTAAADGGGGGGGGSGGGGDMASAVRNTDPDYRAGMDAVARKDWKQVVTSMDAYVKRKPDDADAWTELGHAHRLTGRIDASLEAYDKALKIDPRHRGAHEYLGEAYLQMNDLPRAEEQLKVLDKLCFFSCEEFRHLKAHIGEYKKTKQAAGS